MTEFADFRWKETGIVQSLPAHYETHPVFGAALERYTPGDDEYEEDKVVVAGHEAPVEQRAVKVATPKDDVKKEDK